MEKTISVVIPSYNRAHLIRRAVESVQTQTYPAICEIVIVDDGSKDQTEEVVKAIGDPRIRYVKLDGNHGAGYARNRGVDAATGDFIAFCDSDDYWTPDKLERQLSYMQEVDADMCFHAFERVYQNGEKERVPEGFPSKSRIDISDLVPLNKASTQTFLLTKACAKSISFDEEVPSLEDWEYAVRLCFRGFRVAYFDEALCHVERQNDSISNNMENGFWAMNKILIMVIRKYNELVSQQGQQTASSVRPDPEEMIEKVHYDQAMAIIQAMENSTSWKMTAPIRKISSLFHGK